MSSIGIVVDRYSGDPSLPAAAGCALQRSTGPFAVSLATHSRGWHVFSISKHSSSSAVSYYGVETAGVVKAVAGGDEEADRGVCDGAESGLQG